MTEDGYFVTIEAVPYEFQRGGNQMMRIKSAKLGLPVVINPEDWHLPEYKL